LVVSGSTLYGTTDGGGANNGGSVFSLNLSVSLNIVLENGQVVLSWADPAFILQTAAAPGNTFNDVSGATSPYTKTNACEQQYFRLREY
jgi:uncharacterized repeat protein (TIGR03803 family)